MKTVIGFPPNWMAVERVFPNCEKHKAIFAYGNTLYNPFNATITKDLIVHEEVHEKQQGDNPGGWWVRYMAEPSFRLDQEIEAYGTQYAYVKKNVQNGRLVEWLKGKLAEALSGETYGNIISYAEAESKIRNYSKTLSL